MTELSSVSTVSHDPKRGVYQATPVMFEQPIDVEIMNSKPKRTRKKKETTETDGKRYKKKMKSAGRIKKGMNSWITALKKYNEDAGWIKGGPVPYFIPRKGTTEYTNLMKKINKKK